MFDLQSRLDSLVEYSYALEARYPRLKYRQIKLAAKGLKDIKGIKPGAKDLARMEDMLTKTDGDQDRIIRLATAMAKAITKEEKALRRAAAALKVIRPKKFAREIAQIFLAKW